MSGNRFPHQIRNREVLEKYAPMWQNFLSRRGRSVWKSEDSCATSVIEQVNDLLSQALAPLVMEIDGEKMIPFYVEGSYTCLAIGAFDYLEDLRERARAHASERSMPTEERYLGGSNIHVDTLCDELSNEVSSLENELASLHIYLKRTDLEHAEQVEKMEKLRHKEAEAHSLEKFGESLSSLGNSLADLNVSISLLNTKSADRKNEIEQQRQANKKLRKRLLKLGHEKKNIELNVETLSRSNVEAEKALFDAKNVSLKLIVNQAAMEADSDNMWKEYQERGHQVRWRKRQYEVEKRVRAWHLKTLRRVNKRVQKTIPGTRLATDIDRTANLYISRDEERLGEGDCSTR